MRLSYRGVPRGFESRSEVIAEHRISLGEDVRFVSNLRPFPFDQ
jgi:hypothetical protein